MQHTDLPAAGLDDLPFRHGSRPRLSIVVAAHGEGGCDGAQLVEHLRFADVTGVDDELRSSQRGKRRGAHQAVCIRDQANKHWV